MMSMMTTAADGHGICHLSGEIDQHRAQRLTREIEEEINRNLPGVMELDFSAVTFMDSSGIALVLRSKGRMEEVGGRLYLSGLPRQAERVLRTAGIHRMVEIEK